MTRRGLARRRSLVAAALVVLLAGCSNGSGGPAEKSSRPSRSASPVGSPTATTHPLRQSISLGCFTCANWVIDVQTQADRDLRREGGYVHVRDLVLVGPSGDDFVFRAVLNRDPGELIAPDGARTPVVGSTGEEVDLSVGRSSSSLTSTTAWSMKGITAPSG